MKQFNFTLLFICFLSAPLFSQGSRFSFKEEARKSILPFSLSFVSGASQGLQQGLLFRTKRFFERFPRANEQYWNPYKSWENKYTRPAYIPVHLTDAYHLSGAVNDISSFAAGAVVGFNCYIPIHEKHNWKKVITRMFDPKRSGHMRVCNRQLLGL